MSEKRPSVTMIFGEHGAIARDGLSRQAGEHLKEFGRQLKDLRAEHPDGRLAVALEAQDMFPNLARIISGNILYGWRPTTAYGMNTRAYRRYEANAASEDHLTNVANFMEGYKFPDKFTELQYKLLNTVHETSGTDKHYIQPQERKGNLLVLPSGPPSYPMDGGPIEERPTMYGEAYELWMFIQRNLREAEAGEFDHGMYPFRQLLFNVHRNTTTMDRVLAQNAQIAWNYPWKISAILSDAGYAHDGMLQDLPEEMREQAKVVYVGQEYPDERYYHTPIHDAVLAHRDHDVTVDALSTYMDEGASDVVHAKSVLWYSATKGDFSKRIAEEAAERDAPVPSQQTVRRAVYHATNEFDIDDVERFRASVIRRGISQTAGTFLHDLLPASRTVIEIGTRTIEPRYRNVVDPDRGQGFSGQVVTGQEEFHSRDRESDPHVQVDLERAIDGR